MKKGLWRSLPQFNAVCPPIDNNIPSGLSRLITSSTNSGVIGTKYTTSACVRIKMHLNSDTLMQLFDELRFSNFRIDHYRDHNKILIV